MSLNKSIFTVVGVADQYSATLSSPSQDCIFDDQNCLKCPKGRKGMLCEIIGLNEFIFSTGKQFSFGLNYVCRKNTEWNFIVILLINS